MVYSIVDSKKQFYSKTQCDQVKIPKQKMLVLGTHMNGNFFPQCRQGCKEI